ncbi:thioesterase family protein [Rhizoctonia solani AG-3 Rhs1AP]|uniref:Thioesterase family protein n=2 Tax=Rhizoctonia solani AG-3 TaxID=1086053 RepID=A0A074S180_9AGAM|nr:thioesterase family protein [Rhizoctonia solani AG-3 Rhs1AP]KEP51280.1 thioesterase family protein [Rhizoctonia solani 123E]
MQLLESFSSSIVALFNRASSLPILESANASESSIISKLIKWTVIVVLILNVKSWPGAWHIRVLVPLLKHRLSGLLNKRGDGHEWWTRVSPVGRSVFPTPDGLDKGALVVLKSRATLDDCDWNGHLSNSSYAKNLDPARMNMLLSWFPAFFDDGGMVALGAAHYQFIREIPINKQYEVRLSIGAWEDKWLYCIAKFVSHTKHKIQPKRNETPNTSTKASLIPSISTPATPLVTETPTPAEFVDICSRDEVALNTSRVDNELILTTALKPTLQTHDADGALLHCVAVSAVCFKHGRITVPPKVVLATSGYSLTETGDKSNWLNAKRLRERGRVAMSEFFCGGWKTEENKFWEISPNLEAERVRRLVELRKLTEGMNGLRV